MNAGDRLSALEGVAELVFHHAHDAMGPLRGVGGVAADVLVAQLSGLGRVEGLLGGQEAQTPPVRSARISYS